MKFWRRPLDMPPRELSRGEVVILAERCKGCGFCIAYCPRGVLDVSDKFNSKGYHPPYVKEADKCVNCHFCEIICPEFAIYSVSIFERKEEMAGA
ncbi:MAG TPA: 4Fe-4S dicluster domain-containing protein [Syntrophales bacterium]|nr:4Fe-4S dicluster domain-containing protein [Syntrophales bacterium]HPO34759.1 4Fe-4S dicluster domain-containing protein [Syntrophales bacterium]